MKGIVARIILVQRCHPTQKDRKSARTYLRVISYNNIHIPPSLWSYPMLSAALYFPDVSIIVPVRVFFRAFPGPTKLFENNYIPHPDFGGE